MSSDEKTPVELFNVNLTDRQLHANVLVVHLDDIESPRCSAAHIAHYLRYECGTAVPFRSGNFVTTSPFLIETSRLGKPFDRVTHDDLASLNKKYDLSAESCFTVLLRREVADLDEALIQADIHQYAATYHAHREDDIEQAYAHTISKMNRLASLQNAVFDAFFSLEPVPSPVNSIAPVSRELDDSGKAHALFWQLSNHSGFRRSLEADSTSDALLRVHTHPDGTFGLGVARPAPLALVDDQTELAHFHHIASNRESVESVVSCLAELLRVEFGLQPRTVEVDQGSRASSLGKPNDSVPDVFRLKK